MDMSGSLYSPMYKRMASFVRRQFLNSVHSSIRPTHSSPTWTGRQGLGLATIPVPPVTQDATSSKGPTAMVFMNMGGPSTTGEVQDFLSRLFVSSSGLYIDIYIYIYIYISFL